MIQTPLSSQTNCTACLRRECCRPSNVLTAWFPFFYAGSTYGEHSEPRVPWGHHCYHQCLHTHVSSLPSSPHRYTDIYIIYEWFRALLRFYRRRVPSSYRQQFLPMCLVYDFSLNDLLAPSEFRLFFAHSSVQVLIFPGSGSLVSFSLFQKNRRLWLFWAPSWTSFTSGSRGWTWSSRSRPDLYVILIHVGRGV